MGAAVARVLPGLTLATTAGATQRSAQPPDDGWRLEIANDDGVVVLATNSAITVATENGVLTATSVVETSGGTSWTLATDDPGLTIDVAAASIGDGATHVTVTGRAPPPSPTSASRSQPAPTNSSSASASAPVRSSIVAPPP